MDFGRREFIKVAIGGLAGFSAVGFEAREGKSEVLASQSRGGAFGTKACKNIIFLVSDGMSAGVLGLAEQFLRMKTGRETNWCRLIRENRCVNGLMDTASLDSLVTDSAAASTAWGSGFRVRNGSINCLPDGTKLTPIAQIAKERGKRIGVVTTATVTHATPAGFAAITPNRDDEFLIASQYLGLVDVALGGGSYFFLPESRLDRKDLVRSFQEHGYTFVENREQLRAVPQNTSKMLGLFSSSHLPYRIDVEGNDFLVGRIPSLAEMTEIALRVLKNSEGFLLQVEGARIDHAAHHNDIATLLREQLEFDQAIGVVLNFVAEYPDTLVIITTDHGNS
ncbi:MAG: alkaline phosphatase, partial [Chthoniobacterales bacterium]|nr:alkaline phosphatase [Chthoniobacterales bacterium]